MSPTVLDERPRLHRAADDVTVIDLRDPVVGSQDDQDVDQRDGAGVERAGVRIVDAGMSRRDARIKRAVDVVVGGVLAVLTLPVVVILAFVLAIELRAWPFFVQDRVGQGGRPFRFPKLRTLHPSVSPYALKTNQSLGHLSPFRATLRSLHLDELPQLWLVVAGQMSLVGPRPRMPDAHEPVDPDYAAMRSRVPQGCTGLWQIGAHKHLLPSDSPQYDEFYVRHANWRLDVFILVQSGLQALGLGRARTPMDLPGWVLRPQVIAPAPVAIVHDYLTQRGGAERVVLELLAAHPGAVVHTAVYDPESTFPEFRNHRVVELAGLSRFLLRRFHRLGVIIYPLIFRRTTIDAEVVVISSSGFAHGVRCTGRKIVYCHNPPRWLHQGPEEYGVASHAARLLLRVAGGWLRQQDRQGAATADLYLANSSIVVERIRNAYARSATLVHPPVTLSPAWGAERGQARDGNFLVVSRQLPYKGVDVVVRAFADLSGDRLVVVGNGPEHDRLRALATSNVEFLTDVSDEELAGLYASSEAVVTAAFEDFGLVPIEAASQGTPTVALAYGGHLETVVDGVTGVLFDHPDPAAVVAAISRLRAAGINRSVVETHALRFSPAAFHDRIRTIVGPSSERDLSEVRTGRSGVVAAGSPQPVTAG